MLKRIFALAILVVILLVLPFSFSARIRDISVQTIRPIGKYLVERNKGIHNFILNIRQIGSLRDDKLRLQTENSKLQQSLSDQETIRRENERLRKEVGVTGITNEYKKVLAHIVLIGSDGRDKTFTIDVGTSSGIQVNQAAISEGVLVGRVLSVRQHSAVVRSTLSRESKIQAWIATSREKGTLVGNGNSVSLTEITQGVDVQKNDVVETSGLGGSLPQGIIIGSINEMISKKSETTQSYSLNLAQNPTSLESVFILLTDS